MHHPEPSTSQPSWPPHPREDLHRFVNELNIRYNLGIPIPDPATKRKADLNTAARAYRRLESHFYRGGLEDLHALLRDFDQEAKAFWSKWVKKPQGDHDTLPCTSVPPLAANFVEREWLQQVFHGVLDKAQSSMPAPRIFGRSQSGPAGFGNTSVGTSTVCSSNGPSSTQPKRRADVDLGDASKRTKADPIKDLTSHRPGPASASAPRTGVVAPSTTRNPSFRSTTSASTSATSFQSAIFSTQGDPPVATQDTVEASSQELRRTDTNPARPFSQDSFVSAPSSATQEALHISFTEFEALQPEARLPEASLFARQASHGDAGAVVPAQKSSESYDILRRIWPTFPAWLRDAPFPVAWELTRIAQHCRVDLQSVDLTYEPSWTNQKELRASLWRHSTFKGKAFPESSNAAAWAASLEQSPILPFDQQVVYSASLSFSDSKAGLLQLTIHPLKLEQSHRLGRHFGADRFLELLLPSPDSSNLPVSFKNRKSESFFEDLVRWLADEHSFCGRYWKAFYTKSGGSRKPVRDLQFGPEPRPVYTDRVYFFAESAESNNFVQTPMYSMLDWVLQFNRKPNRKQPILKLFQRIALVLSKTSPSVVFKHSEIRHQERDLVSPTGKVMNDGVARMSPMVATRIKACLGLTVTPSAVQGRLGSAKGMWIVDVDETSDKIWIETFPSQRKWDLDWVEAHNDHLTLEIRNFASMPRSASFNLQFLPVLEDRANDKTLMRTTVGNILENNLQEELDGQKRALQSSLQYRQWTHENSSHKQDRLIHGHVPYLGGMPQADEELMNCTLDAGFDPRLNAFLKETAYNMQLRKCQALEKKLNTKVGRSAYLYMVVDFWGVLEEDEVHVGFSTAFEADNAWSKTMVHGSDVLVARSPAHFISDVQRVKAVFKPELADLTDVVVFSAKGDVPLADKLSGGDYDGDLAWVCWDSRIVDNFRNAEVQEQPDLSRYMSKDKETFSDLLSKHRKPNGKASLGNAVSEMMVKSFGFNLTKSMLGVCTNYKERLCYKNNTVGDDAARMLSTLLSNLVDQAKQGVRFTAEDFDRLRRDFKLPLHANPPLYKDKSWPLSGPRVHIIDFLKFDIAQRTIARELKAFNAALEEKGSPSNYDQDLVMFFSEYNGQADSQSHSKSMSRLLTHLRNDIKAVAEQWKSLGNNKTTPFADVVSEIYTMWQNIRPREEVLNGRTNTKTVRRLMLGGEMSHWQLLKASTAFWMFCNSGNRVKYGTAPRFVWQMACRQLCHLKAMAVAERSSPGAAGAIMTVMAHMYAAFRPDTKFIKQREAKLEGEGSQFSQGFNSDVEMDDDD